MLSALAERNIHVDDADVQASVQATAEEALLRIREKYKVEAVG